MQASEGVEGAQCAMQRSAAQGSAARAAHCSAVQTDRQRQRRWRGRETGVAALGRLGCTCRAWMAESSIAICCASAARDVSSQLANETEATAIIWRGAERQRRLWAGRERGGSMRIIVLKSVGRWQRRRRAGAARERAPRRTRAAAATLRAAPPRRASAWQRPAAAEGGPRAAPAGGAGPPSGPALRRGWRRGEGGQECRGPSPRRRKEEH